MIGTHGTSLASSSKKQKGVGRRGGVPREKEKREQFHLVVVRSS